MEGVIEGQKGEERWVMGALGPLLDSLLGSWSSNLVSDFAGLWAFFGGVGGVRCRASIRVEGGDRYFGVPNLVRRLSCGLDTSGFDLCDGRILMVVVVASDNKVVVAIWATFPQYYASLKFCCFPWWLFFQPSYR